MALRLQTPNGSDTFKMAKQMERESEDQVTEMCIVNDRCDLALNDNENIKAWVEHYGMQGVKNLRTARTTSVPVPKIN